LHLADGFYHILNRSVGKMKLFRRDEDFLADTPVSPLHFKKTLRLPGMLRARPVRRAAQRPYGRGLFC